MDQRRRSIAAKLMRAHKPPAATPGDRVAAGQQELFDRQARAVAGIALAGPRRRPSGAHRLQNTFESRLRRSSKLE